MLKNTLFISFLCLVSLFSHGNDMDSLKKQIEGFPFPDSDTTEEFVALLNTDTSLLFTISDACTKLGNYYLKNNRYQDGLPVFQNHFIILKALDRLYPVKGNYRKELITVYNRAGASSLFLNDYENARKYFLNALDYFFRLNLIQQKNIEVRAGLFNVYVNLGKIYSYINDFPMALTYYLKALEISETLKDYNGSNTVCIQLGYLYRQQKRYDSAISWFTRGMKISEVLGSQKEPADAYFQMGETFFIKGNKEEARNFFSKSNRIWKAQLEKKPNDSLPATRLLTGYMFTVKCLEDTLTEKSMGPFFNESHKILPLVKDKKVLSIYYERKSELARIKGDHKNGINFMLDALKFAREAKDGNLMLNCTEKLFQYYEKIKKITETNFYKNEFSKYKDSISEVQKKLELRKKEIRASIEKQSEEEQKLTEIRKTEEAQEQEKSNRLRLVGYIFLGIVILFGLYLLKKRKK